MHFRPNGLIDINNGQTLDFLGYYSIFLVSLVAYCGFLQSLLSLQSHNLYLQSKSPRLQPAQSVAVRFDRRGPHPPVTAKSTRCSFASTAKCIFVVAPPREQPIALASPLLAPLDVDARGQKSSGISRQVAPVRSFHKIASIIFLLFLER